MTQTFQDFGLAAPILKALAATNYTTPTPIQAQAIPETLKGRDILGIAQTGTGKTAAFALPIVNRLLADKQRAAPKGCRVLVLSPTRELASQIADSFRAYSRFANLSVTTVFGGVGYPAQIRALSRGVDILVATPGRLLDLMESGHCNLSSTNLLVLDEADQMLDLGFLKPIRTIAAKTSKERQSLFFSATFPKEIEAISRELLRDPVSVRVTPVSSTAERVEQKVIHVEQASKGRLLVELLNDDAMVRTLVFTRTKRGADKVTKFLTQNGLTASAIHGNKSQNQRERALDAFRRSEIKVLVATDIAARGIDIPQVSHVVNHDLPEVPEAYVHRIGRTARAGHSGQAITLCDPGERSLLRDIERLTKQSIASERSNLRVSAEARPASQDGPDRQDRPDRGAQPRRDGANAGRRDHRAGRGAGPRKPYEAKPHAAKHEDSAQGDAPRRHKPRRPDGHRSAQGAGHAHDHATAHARGADRGRRPNRNDVAANDGATSVAAPSHRSAHGPSRGPGPNGHNGHGGNNNAKRNKPHRRWRHADKGRTGQGRSAQGNARAQ